MCEGYVQEGWIMWKRKPGFDICPGASFARGSRAYLVAMLYAVAVPGSCSQTAECILPVVVPETLALLQLLG